MHDNEILRELREIRDDYARAFNYDLSAMFEDWQNKEKQAKKQGRKVITSLTES